MSNNSFSTYQIRRISIFSMGQDHDHDHPKGDILKFVWLLTKVLLLDRVLKLLQFRNENMLD
jgi:hypothetical protein